MHIFQKTFVAVFSLVLASTSWSADFEKGQEAYNSADYQTALTEWQVLAEAGLADGQYGLGLLYANGFGVPLDDDQALKWYRLAADQGHAKAQCNLGVMYANGWGVPQSDSEAFKWHSLASEQGVAPAQVSLAMMYMGGYGTTQNNIQASKWFNIAAELGDFNAASKRDYLNSLMTAEEVAEANGLAKAWLDDYQKRGN